MIEPSTWELMQLGAHLSFAIQAVFHSRDRVLLNTAIDRPISKFREAGIKLTSVASTVWSVSSRQIIEALIDGERNPAVLAEMAKGRMRPKIAALSEALSGCFGAHHAVVCRQIIDHIDFLDRSIAALTEEVTSRLAPFETSVRILCSMPGISRTTAEVVIAETGADMSRFPTPEQLCAWAGVAPASRESAGKHQPTGTHHGCRWLRQALVEAARGAARTKGSYYSALYARIARRRGPNKAAVAVANSMLNTIWHLLATDSTFEDPGADYFQRRHDPELEAKRLARRIEALGYSVNIGKVA